LAKEIEKIGKKVGKSKSAVSNTLRLLELDEEIQKAILGGAINEGCARALLSIPDKDKRKEAYQKILTEKFTVRDVENFARGFHARRPRTKAAGKHKSPEVLDIQDRLEKHLGTKVEIAPGASPENGKIVIHYYTLDDFDRITRILKK